MTTDEPCTFGWDTLDALDCGGYDGWAFDVIDVIEGRQRDIPTLCLECHQTWLMGPQALVTGKCWRCRTNGGSA